MKLEVSFFFLWFEVLTVYAHAAVTFLNYVATVAQTTYVMCYLPYRPVCLML